jgi:predicted sugar kinase
LPKQDISLEAMNKATKIGLRARELLAERFGLGSGTQELSTGEGRQRMQQMSTDELNELVDIVGLDRVLADAEELA